MQWDIFCRVIDNLGDIGVCWRLCADLAARGEQVRLWSDDASVLEWMAPGANQGTWPGVQVLAWKLSTNAHYLASLAPADVWIEGFGCDLAPEFIAARVSFTRASGLSGTKNPIWINLEYLSAEPFVERSHGLPSPVMQGQATGWTKHFFYPGFTDKTGGLLREQDLVQRMSRFDATHWLLEQGIRRRHGERLIALFCYEPPALMQLLSQLAAEPEPSHLLVTPGRATAAVQAATSSNNGLKPSWNLHEVLSISYLPAFSQPDFDHLLWACDMNFVRGEDSLVRALWAGKPLVWQIYPQEDAAHHAKLDAFLDLVDAPLSMRLFHRQWNGLRATTADEPMSLNELNTWAESMQSARLRLLKMDSLTDRLLRFVQKKQ
jgi:uncharacterized repeat protein (TIGR03837 family)